jgi:hypothetical protein
VWRQEGKEHKMLARLAISSVLLAVLSTPILAQGRPDARQMSCDQVQSLIQQAGAAVLTTGRHTYDRYVAHGGFCTTGDRAVVDTVPTRDTSQCWVYRCQQTSYDNVWPQ